MKRLLVILSIGMVMTSIAVCNAEEKEKTEDALTTIVTAPIKVAEGGLQAAADVAGGGLQVAADVAGTAVKALVGIGEGVQTFFETDILAGTELFVGREAMDSSGITLGVSLINIYQQNMRGGLSTHNKRGRFMGRHDVEIAFDLERLGIVEGGGFYVNGEGSYSKTGGIDGPSVGSALDVNGKSKSRRSMVISDYWYQQALFDGVMQIRLGKLDLTDGFSCGGKAVAFDGSSYAGSNSSRFLNTSFANNPTIPFKSNGLGLALFYNPNDFWYVAGGMSDADPRLNSEENGFNTTFHNEDYFLYVFETGVVPQVDSDKGPMTGAYRFGFWVDGKDKARNSNGRNYRDDMGFYTSCDQLIRKENNDPEDSQGLGVFFRFGYANNDLNDIANFWSGGFQYQGLIDGRNKDLCGIGVSQALFADSSSSYTDNDETVFEVYYNAKVSSNLSLSPTLQYVMDPGGNDTATDAVVLGLRARMTF